MQHLRPEAAPYVVGIDLGGTKVVAGIAGGGGAIVADRREPTATGGELVGQLARLVRELARDADIDPERIVATGIGGAGVPEGGAFGLAPNLVGAADASFAGRLSEALTHPVVLENDVNVAALGELHHGVGRRHRDFAVVAVGTGIGMGIVIDGRLVRGSRGAAGEIGFLPLGADPLAEENRRRGPLEEMVAGDAMAERFRRAAGVAATAEEIFERAGRGDPAALDALDEEAKWVAAALVAAHAVLDPELFVLTGGIGSHPGLLPRVRDWLARHGAGAIDVRISELGAQAPVAGAIRLALDSLTSISKGTDR
jgi:predicted NBD/HSP70 family sugar kinase